MSNYQYSICVYQFEWPGVSELSYLSLFAKSILNAKLYCHSIVFSDCLITNSYVVGVIL